MNADLLPLPAILLPYSKVPTYAKSISVSASGWLKSSPIYQNPRFLSGILEGQFFCTFLGKPGLSVSNGDCEEKSWVLFWLSFELLYPRLYGTVVMVTVLDYICSRIISPLPRNPNIISPVCTNFFNLLPVLEQKREVPSTAEESNRRTGGNWT